MKKENLQTIMICSVRYALGRNSLISAATIEAIDQSINDLTEDTIRIIYKDISNAIERNDISDDCFILEWTRLLDDLSAYILRKSAGRKSGLHQKTA